MAMSFELAEWLARQARIRDCTASALMRSLLRAAQQETAPATWPPWPPIIETPLRVLANRPRKRDAKGRVRDLAGRFMPE